MIPEPAKKYTAPRDYPLSYPGRRPSYGFILANDMIWPLAVDKETELHDAKVMINSHGDFLSLNGFLKSKHVSALEKRYAVIGYGSNPVPGQLLDKFGKNAVVPVVFGNIRNCDIVYNLISNLGYAFAEISFDENFTEKCVGITFLDKDQLNIMIETEQNYQLAYSPLDVTLESGEIIQGGVNNSLYIFAGSRKIWVPSAYDAPVAIAEFPSSGGNCNALTQMEILQLAIKEFNLKKYGISTPNQLVERIRNEAHLEEKPGKLKYEIQKAVSENPRSLLPLANSLTLVGKSIDNIKMFTGVF